MDIGKMKVDDVLAIARLINPQKVDTEHHYEIGKNYFIRTVTWCYLGKLIAVHAQEFVLTNVSLIGDTGTFTKALAEADSMDEIEVYPPDKRVTVGRGALIDAVEYDHDLPTVRK